MELWLSVVDSISAVQGLIIGALLPGLGALITIRIAHLRQDEDAERESRERQNQRIHDLRREVYLPAIQATIEMLGGIVGIIDLRNNEADFTRTAQQFAAAIAKVFMVGSDNTIRNVAKLQRALMREHFESISIRQGLLKSWAPIERLTQNRQRLYQERERHLEMMNAMTIQKAYDSEHYVKIERQANILADLAAEYTDEIDRLSAPHHAVLLGYMRVLPDRMDPLADLYVGALVAIRAELKIEGGATTLPEELLLNAAEVRAALHTAINRLIALYGDPSQPALS